MSKTAHPLRARFISNCEGRTRERSSATIASIPSFVSIAGLQRDEACILDNFDGQHAQERLILNDQNNSSGFWPDVVHWVRQLRNSRFASSE